MATDFCTAYSKKHVICTAYSKKTRHVYCILKKTSHLYCILKKTRHLYCILKKVLKKTFVLHTQKYWKKRTSFVLRTQKSTQKVGKKGGKKGSKKAAKRQQKKTAKKLAKKYTKKAHCHLHNEHATHQKKNFLKHILEPVMLLSWNRSKTDLVFPLTKYTGIF